MLSWTERETSTTSCSLPITIIQPPALPVKKFRRRSKTSRDRWHSQAVEYCHVSPLYRRSRNAGTQVATSGGGRQEGAFNGERSHYESLQRQDNVGHNCFTLSLYLFLPSTLMSMSMSMAHAYMHPCM
uniref:Uncharacterized protein n=1 Tax=Physcomitrium patens TaxID=3218 RepID=A0A2K1KGW3_PHYPA|nr:hypothetical protein PHYPA_009374 [Physcomitrium patens]